MTTCPDCQWDNDAATGRCAGCGRELTGPSEPAPVPVQRQDESEREPRPSGLGDDAYGGPVPPSGGLLRQASAAVPITPHRRSAPQVIEPRRQVARAVDLERSQADRVAPRDVAPQVRPRTVVVRPAERSIAGGRGGGPVAGGVLLDGAGAVTCRTCGRSVPSQMHFCRCGTQVSGAAAVSRTEPETALDAGGMTRQRFDQAQRRANGGHRVRFDEPLSMRTWLFRVLLILVVLATIGSQVPPWGADVRGWITDRLDIVLSTADDG